MTAAEAGMWVFQFSCLNGGDEWRKRFPLRHPIRVPHLACARHLLLGKTQFLSLRSGFQEGLVDSLRQHFLHFNVHLIHIHNLLGDLVTK